METASSVIQVLGLLLILVGAAFVFARGITWIFRRRGNRVRLGLEVLAFFMVTYLFALPALQFLGLERFGDDVVDTVSLLWWLSVAFVVDAGLKRYLWFGVLRDSQDASRVPKLLQDTATAIVYAVAIMVVMHFVYEEPITAVLATSGAAAFVIGFSAQSTIKEVFAGLSLSAARALHIGDYLEIDGVYGRVHEINWRSISLHNPHTDSLYIFPNSAVAEKIILNYSEPTGRFKNWVKFTVEPAASPELVTRVVLESLKHSRYVMREPTPDMNILGFNNLGIEYRIRYFFEGDDPWWDAQNEVVSAIWSSLRRHGLRVSVQRFQLQTGDELAESFWPVRKELDEEEILTHLRASPVLAGLGQEDLLVMAKAAVCRDYEPPDCIYLEGTAAGGLFLVADGRLTATRSEGLEAEADVATWQPGDVIGITGLVSGDRHCETAQAAHYSVVYEIGSEIVRPMAERNEAWKRTLEARSRDFLADYERTAAISLENRRHREHVRHKAHLVRSLRDHIRATFGKGIVLSFLGTVSRGPSEKEILDAVMAASALVVGAGGTISTKERANVVEALESLHLLKHTDHDSCMAAFDIFAALVTTSEGREKALTAVRKASGDKQIAHMVVGICHSVHGLSGKIDDSEHAEIELIAEALGVSARPDEISAMITEANLHA